MNARVAIFVATLVVVMLIAVPVLWRRVSVHSHAGTDSSAKKTSSHATPAATDGGMAAPEKLPDAPSRDLVGRDGVAAAELWQVRAKRVLFAKNSNELGAEVARLMQLPYDDAWAPLRELASDGNIGAATALGLIGTVCNAETAMKEQHKPQKPPSAASGFFKDLPENWKPFVDRLAEIERAEHNERVSHCAGIGDTWDFVTLLLDKFLQSDHPDVLADLVADNNDATQAIADLREVIAKGAGPHAEFLLGDRLLRQQDPAQQAEGRATLERLAADDPAVAARLAYCLINGCQAFAAQPGAARPWLELAAGGGDEFGTSLLMDDLNAHDDVVAAWAWSLYALDLALDGCYERVVPMYRAVATAAANESRYRAQLSPAQQNAGLATFYEISGRSEQKAKERMACAD